MKVKIEFDKQGIFNSVYAVVAVGGSLGLGKLLYAWMPLLPASLYGMIFFTASLQLAVFDANKIAGAIEWALRHMGLCFVPAGVGIINHFELIKQHGLAIVAIIFITTFMLLSLVGWCYQWHLTHNLKDYS